MNLQIWLVEKAEHDHNVRLQVRDDNVTSETTFKAGDKRQKRANLATVTLM
ncbi:MAG: hypothetical protein R3C14_17620 [Caldilineaceae bacterium]